MAQTGKDKQPEERPPRRNWAGPVARDVSFAGHEAFARAGFQDPTLILRWEEIAGPDVARVARPVRMTESAHGQVLTLKTEPGAAIFLQHESRALCERINAFLGRPAVARLRFLQGPLARRPVRQPANKAAAAVPPEDPALAYTGEGSLRDALVRLAKARKS